MTFRRATLILVAGITLASARPAISGIVIEDKPASLVTRNLVMRQGQPFVRLADLAKALGGTGRYDAGKLRYEIRPGARGVLLVNPGALGALAHPPGANLKGQVATENSFKLSLGGQDVMIEEEEHVMLRPGDPSVSLRFLGRLLGGQARFDASKGMWLLPPGGPGSPLRFR